MSKARSPREVCSTTIGIRGLMSLLARWCPQLLGRGAVLAWGPDALTRSLLLPPLRCLLRRDRLHLGDDPVERLAHPDAVAEAVRAAFREERVDVRLVLAGLDELGANLLVPHREPELVGDRLEHQLARDSLRGL